MNKPWSIPVLLYHGLHTPGWDYHENDHVALEQDLEMLRADGFKVISLTYLVDLILNSNQPAPAHSKLVALTFDDGTDFDYKDFHHPDYGYLKSFHSILKAYPGLGLDRGCPSATSFVIASPEAREELDRSCIAGRGQMGDDWWLESAENGPISIANHSWDHTHPSLDQLVVDSSNKGRFDLIDNFESADAEILNAERFIQKKTNKQSLPFFAYPYGHFNEFLADEYFPSRSNVFKAAFTTAGRPVCSADSRWLIPRFVYGEHWKTPQGLEQILAD
jgi:peptidoglycan/xylan/chitin deacetylase (PgdA/CDA1 family)